MSLYETLMTWPPERLAKELQGQARENAALKRRVLELEVQLFWMNVADAVREWPAGGTLGSGISGPASTAHTIAEPICGTATLPAARGFGLVAARPRTPDELACWCSTCRPINLDDMRMVAATKSSLVLAPAEIARTMAQLRIARAVTKETPP